MSWYARVVVALRWPVVLFWAATAAAALLLLPAPDQGGNDLSQLVSSGNPAVRSEVRSAEKFGFPLLSRVAVVQRKPEGLSPSVQLAAVKRAREISEGAYPDVKPVVAAVPILNTAKLLPGAQESGTTAITYLFIDPEADFADQVDAANSLVDKHFQPDDHVVGVTGSVPARVEQGRIVLSSLTWLEIVTVVAVFLIVAFAFRSFVAPLLALAVAGVAIVLTLRVGAALAVHWGVPVPQETQPLLVALLLGVVTDYVVFYLSAVRTHAEEGAGRHEAARLATARFTPIIVTAAATAAAGTGALIVARSAAFRAFGPGMALSILIGMIVAVTLVPALAAILGRAAVWSPWRRRVAATEAPPTGRWASLLTRRWVAVPVLLVCGAGLVAAALPARHLHLAVSFVEALPDGNPARKAATAAETGFGAGILSPTELLLEGNGVTTHQEQLTRLQQELSREPGVAGVLGPGDDAIPAELKLFRAPDGNAARFLIVLADEPLGASAIHTLDSLRQRLPGLVNAAGLTGVQASLGGDTAIAQSIVDQTTGDMARIAIAALLANLFFLALFLRALVVPLGLLACSVLAIAATLGLTTWLFQDVLGEDGMTFYVPFAAAVLLVALGSDYNIFGIGPAWREARTRPLREALEATLPQSARAIRIAAVTLAVSFGLLVMIPLRPFQELAFALSVGILIDAFVIRSVLAPALLSAMGSLASPPIERFELAEPAARQG